MHSPIQEEKTTYLFFFSHIITYIHNYDKKRLLVRCSSSSSSSYIITNKPNYTLSHIKEEKTTQWEQKITQTTLHYQAFNTKLKHSYFLYK